MIQGGLMSIESEPSAPTEATNDHDWMGGMIAQCAACQSELAMLPFSEQFTTQIDPDSVRRIPTKHYSAEHGKRDADTAFTAKFSGTGHALRILIEYKSGGSIGELIAQYLRYQVGLYRNSRVPVVNVLISNDASRQHSLVPSMREWLDAMTPSFWDECATHVMDFKVLVVDLTDARVRKRIDESGYHSAFALLALGTGLETVDEDMVKTLARVWKRMAGEPYRDLRAASLRYLRRYHDDSIIEAIMRHIEKDSEDYRMMSELLTVEEMVRRDGIEIGIEQGIESVAERMLQEGFREDSIRKCTGLSEERITYLKNGRSGS